MGVALYRRKRKSLEWVWSLREEEEVVRVGVVL
jgi:hypothetical protein